jgi:hypothetical protein
MCKELKIALQNYSKARNLKKKKLTMTAKQDNTHICVCQSETDRENTGFINTSVKVPSKTLPDTIQWQLNKQDVAQPETQGKFNLERNY